MDQEKEIINNNISFELFYKYFGLVADKLVPEQYVYVWAACGIMIHSFPLQIQLYLHG